MILAFLSLISPLVASFSPNEDEFAYHHRLIFFEAELHGEREVLCLLDTGANRSAVNAALADELDLEVVDRVKVYGTAGIDEVDVVEVDGLATGDAEVDVLTVTKSELGGFLAPDGRALDVIVGFDFLKDYAVQIDFRDRTIRFLDAEELPKGKEVLPLQLDNGIPRVKARLNEDFDLELRIDTGASLFESEHVFLNITENDWGRLKAKDPSLAPYTHFEGSGVGGTTRLPVAKVRSFTFGERVFKEPRVIVQGKVGYFSLEGAVGFLGNNCLEKFHWIAFDYPNRKLHLGPPQGSK